MMNEDESGPMDRFVDQSQLPPDTRSESLDQLAQLRTAMGALTDIELEILRRKFGLDGTMKQQRKAIIEDLGISHEWFRQTQRKALKKLKRELTAASA
jgi:DNA-directed RNA polymerase sigma subunit (sigma70/sigma32)